jgi:ElaB/YqjD/DUF883 family membrane-anchored ribosome-binding protein
LISKIKELEGSIKELFELVDPLLNSATNREINEFVRLKHKIKKDLKELLDY